MKQKMNVAIISVLAVGLLIVSFIFAVSYRNENIKYFHDSGYIISSAYESGSDNINKLYFDVETSYATSKENTYTFTNTEGEKVKVSEDSFVHYENGAIMSLKKGVAIDLNDIDAKLISYYNVFEGSVLNKKNEVYEIDNLGESITFSKLMFKISNNKYLIASKNIIASFSDNQTVEFKKYIEVEYVSENVIKIYNDEINYQTITSNLYLIIDDVKIDLAYKTISKNNVEYLTMADMIINSDDNIEILPEKEAIITPNEGVDNGENIDNSAPGGNSGTNPGTNIEGNFENLFENLPNGDEQLDTDDEFIQPKFKVDDIKVTTLGFENLQLSFEDESSVLYGDRSVEILENSTGKVVQKFDNWEEGMSNYIVNSYFALKPNTEYTINVVGQYKIKDTIYDRTFVSKIFRTLDIGLEIDEDYITSDSLSFAIYKNSYSEVNGFSYDVKDKDGNIIPNTSGNVRFENSDVAIVTIENKFNANTDYIFTIKDIVYGNDMFISELYQSLKLTYKTKTLKESPFNDELELDINVNDLTNSVVFSANGLNDVYGGIVSYTYNIYNEYNELIKTVVNEDGKKLSLNRNELDSNANNVYFDVQVNFDDNEKTIIYTSESSNPISITGVVYPEVVKFETATGNTNHQEIVGFIVIDDKKDYVKVNSITKYKVVVKEKNNGSLLAGAQQFLIEHTEVSRDGIINLPISIENLKPQTEYVLSIYLEYNDKSIYIGYVSTMTSEVTPVYLDIVDKPGNSGTQDTLFDFEVSLSRELNNYSSSHLNYLGFDLYGCFDETHKINQCTKLNYSAVLPENQSAQVLYEILTQRGALDVLSNDFDFYIDDLQEYPSYRVTVTGHSFGYDIPIYVNGTDSNEFNLTFNDISPELSIKPIEIINDGINCGEFCDAGLNSDTIVGYKFEINSLKNPMGEYVSKVIYSIERKIDDSTWEPVLENNEINIGMNQNFAFSLGDETLTRGHIYRVKYYGKFDKNGSTDKQTEDFYSEEFSMKKQKAQIKGHLASYHNNELKFNLEVTDLDNALQKYNFPAGQNADSVVILINTNDGTEIFPTINGDYYTFNEINSNVEYKLKVKEKILDELNERELYKVIPESIVTLDNVDTYIELDGDSPGKVVLSVSSPSLDKIVGIEILSTTTSSMNYFPLDENKKVQLNLRNIKLSGLGEITGDTLKLNKINLIYDSGEMVDLSGEPVFIKNRDVTSGDLNYFDNETNLFSRKIKLNYNEFDQIMFLSKSLLDNGAIGKFLQSDSLNRTVLLNKAERLTYNDLEVNVVDVLSTDSVNIINKTEGAKIKFNILDEINNNVKFKFELIEGGNISSKVYDYSTKTIVESTGTGIHSITGVEGLFEVEFNEFDDSKNYSYSVLYSTDNGQSYIFVYDEESQSNIQEKEISSLKTFPILSGFESKHTSNNVWKWNDANNPTDLTFEKMIKNSFKVDYDKYELNSGEIIKYSIEAVNVENPSDNVKFFEDFEVDSSKTKQVYAENFDLSGINLKGIYKVQLISKITDNNGVVKEFEPIILNNGISINVSEPTLNVNTNGRPIFTFSMNDPSGLLKPFDEEDELDPHGNIKASNNLIMFYDDTLGQYILDEKTNKYFNNLTTEPVGAKAVYFALYRVESGSEVFKGFVPIPFVHNTLTLNLTKHFVNNQLASGEYVVELYYKLGDNVNVIRKDFRIYNASLLNIQVVSVAQNYIIVLNNPDTVLKESIDRIEYQYIENGNIITRYISGDDIQYSSSTNPDSTITYYLGIDTGGSLTSTLQDLTINFYDGSQLVATYSNS